MDAIRRALHRALAPRRRAAVWRDMDEEMRQHVSLEADELVRQGVAPEEARRQALVAFGPIESWREEGWETRLPRWLDDFPRDARVSARSLRRSPGFAVMAIVCIALGIGATAAVFALVDAVLLRPLPYAHADRLLSITSSNPKLALVDVNISRQEFLAWREQARSFAAAGMWDWSDVTLAGSSGDAERVPGGRVTAGFFTMLGVRPVLGRDFAAAEETTGRDRVVLLSDALWQRRFGGDRAVLGRSLLVEGVPCTVIGVMPPGFAFPETGEIWQPVVADPGDAPGNRYHAGAIARLRDGVTAKQAEAELDRISRDLQRANPHENAGWEADPMPLRTELVGNLQRPVLVFAGAVLCVLLIACANVANLLLARGAARRRELAVRAAIGAGRGRVIRQLLAESLVLAGMGAVLGSTLTIAGVRLAARAFPRGVPYYLHLAVDARVVGFIALLAALTAVVFGTLPAWRASDLDLGATLKEGTSGSGESARRARARSALVIAEIALSLVLLLSASLLVRSYRALTGSDLGFATRGRLAFQVSMPDPLYPQPAQRTALLRRLFERLRALPAVEAVGSARGIPMTGWDVQANVSVEGQPVPAPTKDVDVHYQYVTPDYFRVIGVPLHRGRGFGDEDRPGSPPAIVVNERFVRTFLPGKDPLGSRVKTGDASSPDPWATVVGVIGDFQQYSLPQPKGPAIYYDFFQDPGHVQTVVMRTALPEPAVLAPTVRALLHDIDPNLPAYQVSTLDEVVSRSLWRQRLQSQTLGLFAALALLLAVVGLYGVIAYAVGQRRREFGLRVAMGATAQDVMRGVVAQGARLAALGIGIGMVVSLVVTRALAGLLYEVRPFDPLTFLGMPLLLALVTLVASAVPAWAAARVDPQRALRTD